jgi:hypothetical protein
MDEPATDNQEEQAWSPDGNDPTDHQDEMLPENNNESTIIDEDPISEWQDNQIIEDETTEETKNMLSIGVMFEGLESLGEDFVYEGWLITEEGPVSTGRFEIDEDGMAWPNTFALEAHLEEDASLFVLTIEPAVDDAPGPTAVHILAGEILDGAADLSIGHGAALGTDFVDAEGMFILKTPTTGDTDEDDNQGIWWADPAAGPGPTLSLPELPEGWIYEGWVVGADGPISTGTFLFGDEADSDGPGATAGPDGSPPFPGQDFIWPAMELIGFKAVISVEPVPDNSDHPFLLKPLFGDVEDVGGGVLQPMVNKAENAPTGHTWFFQMSDDQ